MGKTTTNGFLTPCVAQHVYDAGPFLGEHPGGAEALAKWLGRDATAAFARIVDHEESEAREALGRLRVARVAPPEAAQKSEDKKRATGETRVYIIAAALAAAAVATALVMLR